MGLGRQNCRWPAAGAATSTAVNRALGWPPKRLVTACGSGTRTFVASGRREGQSRVAATRCPDELMNRQLYLTQDN